MAIYQGAAKGLRAPGVCFQVAIHCRVCNLICLLYTDTFTKGKNGDLEKGKTKGKAE